jgi:hypothetical protein
VDVVHPPDLNCPISVRQPEVDIHLLFQKTCSSISVDACKKFFPALWPYSSPSFSVLEVEWKFEVFPLFLVHCEQEYKI